MDASIVKVLQAVQEEFPPKRPSSSGSRTSPPLPHSSPRSIERNTALPPTSSSSSIPPTVPTGLPAIVPGAVAIDPITPADVGSLQYDKQGHHPSSTTGTPSSSKRASPKPTFMELPPKSHSNPFSAGKSSEFGSMRGSDNLMLTPARDDLTFIFKKKDAPLAAL